MRRYSLILLLAGCFSPVDPLELEAETTTPQRTAPPAHESKVPPAVEPELFGVVRADCAPNDGPAFRFALSPTPLTCAAFNSESLSVELWKGDLEPGTYRLSPQFDLDGTANTGGFAGTPVDRGSTLRIDVVGESVTGFLDAAFGGTAKVGATLRVTWCPTARQCG